MAAPTEDALPVGAGQRTALFIRRPILAFVLNADSVLAGWRGCWAQMCANCRMWTGRSSPSSNSYSGRSARNHRPRGDCG